MTQEQIFSTYIKELISMIHKVSTSHSDTGCFRNQEPIFTQNAEMKVKNAYHCSAANEKML